jgi:hypothetical protein
MLVPSTERAPEHLQELPEKKPPKTSFWGADQKIIKPNFLSFNNHLKSGSKNIFY